MQEIPEEICGDCGSAVEELSPNKEIGSILGHVSKCPQAKH